MTGDDADVRSSGRAGGGVKLQRWIDLLAALLVRTHPAPFEELARDVPEYWRKLRGTEDEPDAKRRRTAMDALKRTFERDKDELRAFGVSIESVADTQGNAAGAYRLRRQDFYLPYLCVVVAGRPRSTPRKVDRYGYQALRTLAFEPDELEAVVKAAACVRALGDPVLAAEAESAMRKLAVDLPVDVAAAGAEEPRILLPRARADAATFEVLGDALLRRKRVTFAYGAMNTDQVASREVEPYGLFFVNGHWYLAARDRQRGALRNFRLSRIAQPKINPKQSQTADYEIPDGFRLRDHARSRQAWELGDGDAVEAVVAFRGSSGPAVAASKLGRAVAEGAGRRAFQVRRAEPFVRWLLSFAGEVVPLAPPEIVARYRDEARRALEVHASAPRAAGTRGAQKRETSSRARGDAWQPKGAAAQLRRLLHVVPEIADGEERPITAIAEELGVDLATLRADLFSLAARYDTPPSFTDPVQLYIEGDRVSAFSSHFARPMRLTVSELCALDLGLSVLRTRRPPDEHAALDGARERLRGVIAKLPDDPIPGGRYEASLAEPESATHLAAVQRAIAQRRALRLVYRKSGSAVATERVVSPHVTVASSGTFYLVARCESREGIRVFRMDRVEDVEVLDDTFEPSPELSLDDVLRDGRVFHHERPRALVVRYGPRVARWIAEREGLAPDGDGVLVAEHPLADDDWAIRHVLQYGSEAEVLEPPTLRALVRERLAQMLSVVDDARA